MTSCSVDVIDGWRHQWRSMNAIGDHLHRCQDESECFLRHRYCVNRKWPHELSRDQSGYGFYVYHVPAQTYHVTHIIKSPFNHEIINGKSHVNHVISIKQSHVDHVILISQSHDCDQPMACLSHDTDQPANHISINLIVILTNQCHVDHVILTGQHHVDHVLLINQSHVEHLRRDSHHMSRTWKNAQTKNFDKT